MSRRKARQVHRYRCKLVRGKGFIYDPDGPFVEWRYVEALLERLLAVEATLEQIAKAMKGLK